MKIQCMLEVSGGRRGRVYSPTEANIVQMVLSFGPNQREASLVGAYSRKGWAQAPRNWPIMATKKPAMSKTLEHTMG